MLEQGPDFWCWFDTTQFSYHRVHPIHAKMFSIQMLINQILLRVCTLVIFIIYNSKIKVMHIKCACQTFPKLHVPSMEKIIFCLNSSSSTRCLGRRRMRKQVNALGSLSSSKNSTVICFSNPIGETFLNPVTNDKMSPREIPIVSALSAKCGVFFGRKYIFIPFKLCVVKNSKLKLILIFVTNLYIPEINCIS